MLGFCLFFSGICILFSQVMQQVPVQGTGGNTVRENLVNPFTEINKNQSTCKCTSVLLAFYCKVKMKPLILTLIWVFFLNKDQFSTFHSCREIVGTGWNSLDTQNHLKSVSQLNTLYHETMPWNRCLSYQIILSLIYYVTSSYMLFVTFWQGSVFFSMFWVSSFGFGVAFFLFVWGFLFCSFLPAPNRALICEGFQVPV